MIKIREPKTKLRFEISQKHCASAKRGNPCECVIAKTLKCENSDLLEIQVLPGITFLLWSGGLIERYKTPQLLREALEVFDNTGQWNLPPGEYSLDPLPKTMSRKYSKQRAKARRAKSDKNMDIHGGKSKARLKKRKVSPRLINLREMQANTGKK